MVKTSFSNKLTYLGVALFAVVGIGFGAYYFGIQSKLPVLSNTTSSNPNVTTASQVSSAAYAKCVDNGGFVSTARRGTWGYYQVCNFEDDMTCDLYALYEGQCPIGGVSTIGYDTTAQVFCAQRGGQPMGNENGECKMPDGTICSTASVYEGTCAPN